MPYLEARLVAATDDIHLHGTVAAVTRQVDLESAWLLGMGHPLLYDFVTCHRQLPPLNPLLENLRGNNATGTPLSGITQLQPPYQTS
jgi:hypothetical protein